MAAPESMNAWESFYVIVGSSGAALIGLQFVVITLISEVQPLLARGAISAFGTPTVFHLGGALVISCLMSAPWPSVGSAHVALSVAGLAGIVYGIVTSYRATHQKAYKPVWEDWVWHVILPCAAYLALTFAALALDDTSQVPFFVIAAVALGLLLIGIHNAWDTVIYVVVDRPGSAPQETSNATKEAAHADAKTG
ncbi:MAG TPA: hypothetical protein VGR66_12060 [Candidatus Eisenbacteria bacterium]|jgi:hypothetical protein|nr:hypothetical protein [Candidatus Eisenbacteria bacterium]